MILVEFVVFVIVFLLSSLLSLSSFSFLILLLLNLLIKELILEDVDDLEIELISSEDGFILVLFDFNKELGLAAGFGGILDEANVELELTLLIICLTIGFGVPGEEDET
jgi:hypothetical protein